MALSPLAGKPATKEMLVDLGRLEREYFAARPDPDGSAAAGELRHQRAPRNSLRGSFTEPTSWRSPRRSANTGRRIGITGPLFMGKDTHALSGPAQRTALEVLAANGVEAVIQRDDGFTPTPVISHAILDPQPRAQRRPRRRHRHHALAQSAGGRRLQVQPDQRRPGRHRRHASGSRRRANALLATAMPGSSGCSAGGHGSGTTHRDDLMMPLCRRSATRHRHGRHA